MKRVFVAITFESPEINYLSHVQEKVKEVSEKGKFHKKENLHLTLEFVGMVPEKLINPLWKAIKEGVGDQKKFELHMNRLGYFEKKNKKILWVGVKDEALLLDLQKNILKQIASVIDHQAEHDYTPHITLGRQIICSEMPDLVIERTFQVKEVALMESSSKTGVLLYTPLHSMELK